MKRFNFLMVFVLCFLLLLTGCSGKKAAQTDDGKLNVVCTIFPPYDFAKQITGDEANVSMLLSPGAESHSYEPTPEDIIKIQDCDVFVYNGGESDEWVKEILKSIDTKDKTIIAMMDQVEVEEEQAVPGAAVEEHSEELEYDEHVWTAPKNAEQIVAAISEALCKADSDNAQTYRNNTEAYLKKLGDLDEQFKEVVKNGKRKTIIFGDRFPFQYFAGSYGLKYYAAFPGCSTETEASAATVSTLIDTVKAEKIPVVFYLELSNEKMADAICEATGAKKMEFNACHNISKEDFEKGLGYLDLMEQNVKALEEALN